MSRRDKIRAAREAEQRAETLDAVRNSIRIAPTLSKAERAYRRRKHRRITRSAPEKNWQI